MEHAASVVSQRGAVAAIRTATQVSEVNTTHLTESHSEGAAWPDTEWADTAVSGVPTVAPLVVAFGSIAFVADQAAAITDRADALAHGGTNVRVRHGAERTEKRHDALVWIVHVHEPNRLVTISHDGCGFVHVIPHKRTAR